MAEPGPEGLRGDMARLFSDKGTHEGRPSLGRAIERILTRPGPPAVAIYRASHRLWVRRHETCRTARRTRRDASSRTFAGECRSSKRSCRGSREHSVRGSERTTRNPIDMADNQPPTLGAPADHHF